MSGHPCDIKKLLLNLALFIEKSRFACIRHVYEIVQPLLNLVTLLNADVCVRQLVYDILSKAVWFILILHILHTSQVKNL